MYQGEKVVLSSARNDSERSSIRVEKLQDSSIDRRNVHFEDQRNVINKPLSTLPDRDGEADEIRLGFTCWLLDIDTGVRFPEGRTLRFWFREGTVYELKTTTALEYFKNLLSPPENFPKDHVSFFQKMMKQMRHTIYESLQCVQLDLEVLDPGSLVDPSNGDRVLWVDLTDVADMPHEPVDTRSKEQRISEQLILTLEQAYPNVLDLKHLTNNVDKDEQLLLQLLHHMEEDGIIQRLQDNSGHVVWVRKYADKTAVVKSIDEIPKWGGREKHPTIAVITLRFCEKLAIDAMLDSATTYAKHVTTSEQNSHTYTIGFIGPHKVITTKLPRVGKLERDKTAASNVITRLCGFNSQLEHVIVMTCGGGVAHVTDFFRHVRRGDVVVSRQPELQPAPGTKPDANGLYVSCEKATFSAETRTFKFKTKQWAPRSRVLLDVAEAIQSKLELEASADGWLHYIDDAAAALEQNCQEDFSRPPPETDRLVVRLDKDNQVELSHPQPPASVQSWHADQPHLRLGRLAPADKLVVRGVDQPDSELLHSVKEQFCERYAISCLTPDLDAVLDSIDGNRKESFLLVEGVSDYADGSTQKWQPYAALTAATFIKQLILGLPASSESSV